MSRRIFELISNFARDHAIEIEFEFDCIGELTIKMTRDNNESFKRISGFELHKLLDCDTAILIELEMMLKEIDLKYDKLILAPKRKARE